MGLLTRAWSAIDPLVPDEQVMGLLGRFRGAPEPVAAPQPYDSPFGPITPPTRLDAPPVAAPAPRMRVPNLGGLGAFLKIPGALGSAILDDIQSGPRATAQADKIRQQIAMTPMDPRERAVAMANPLKWAEENASRYGYHGVAPGGVALFGDPNSGGSSYTAPITHAFDDRFGTYDPTTGQAVYTDPRGMTEEEKTRRLAATTAATEGKVVGPGANLVGPDGKPIYSAPFAPQYRNVGPGDKLVEVGGGQPAAGGAVTGETLDALVSSVAPGATMTSATRTPAHNAQVGGVPNSYHLTGRARDYVPPPGVSIPQFAAALRASAPPGVQVIAERDHVHLEPAGGPGGGGARVIAEGAPKPAADDKAPAGYRYRPDGSLEFIPGGPADPKNAKADAKPPTEAQSKSINFAYRALKANDELNKIIEGGHVKPTAWKLVSEKNGVSRLVVNNQADRQFITAAKTWLAPILRKDTGAAVSDSEFIYYADMYIPAPEDGPDLLAQKARNRHDANVALAREAGPLYVQTYGNREFRSAWAPPKPAPATPAAPAATAPRKAPAPGTVQDGYRFKGGDPSKPSSWVKV